MPKKYVHYEVRRWTGPERRVGNARVHEWELISDEPTDIQEARSVRDEWELVNSGTRDSQLFIVKVTVQRVE